MTKQTEAMKLALEAQSYAVACLLNQLSTKDKHAYAVEKLNTSTADLQEALAQPTSAPVQLPQGWSVVLVTGADTKVWPMTEEQIQAAAFSALGLAEQPAQQEPVALKWQQAPVKTQWGDDMVVASVAIDKDHTVCLYCESDQAPKVDAMFAQRTPLTNGEIYTAYITATNQTLRAQDERLAFAFARAIEAAHNIKE